MKWITRERVKVDRIACPRWIGKLTNDNAINAATWIVYDALYAYCQAMIREGKLNGAFKD